jgi:hypothetical protein
MRRRIQKHRNKQGKTTQRLELSFKLIQDVRPQTNELTKTNWSRSRENGIELIGQVFDPRLEKAKNTNKAK